MREHLLTPLMAAENTLRAFGKDPGMDEVRRIKRMSFAEAVRSGAPYRVVDNDKGSFATMTVNGQTVAIQADYLMAYLGQKELSPVSGPDPRCGKVSSPALDHAIENRDAKAAAAALIQLVLDADKEDIGEKERTGLAVIKRNMQEELESERKKNDALTRQVAALGAEKDRLEKELVRTGARADSLEVALRHERIRNNAITEGLKDPGAPPSGKEDVPEEDIFDSFYETVYTEYPDTDTNGIPADPVADTAPGPIRSAIPEGPESKGTPPREEGSDTAPVRTARPGNGAPAPTGTFPERAMSREWKIGRSDLGLYYCRYALQNEDGLDVGAGEICAYPVCTTEQSPPLIVWTALAEQTQVRLVRQTGTFQIGQAVFSLTATVEDGTIRYSLKCSADKGRTFYIEREKVLGGERHVYIPADGLFFHICPLSVNETADGTPFCYAVIDKTGKLVASGDNFDVGDKNAVADVGGKRYAIAGRWSEDDFVGGVSFA